MFGFLEKFRYSPVFGKVFGLTFSLIILSSISSITCSADPIFRLPRDVVPFRYVLELHPDFESEYFQGEVTIAIEILTEKELIVLHAKDLVIKSAQLSRVQQNNETSVIVNDVILKDVFSVTKSDLLFVEPMASLSVGQYWLHFTFNGTMSDKGVGMYKLTFTDRHENTYRDIITTQFQPHHARRAFPCFDEPRFKAIFKIRLVQPSVGEYHSLSNMPVQRTRPGVPLPETTTVYFERSLPISTYIVGCTITDLVKRTVIIPSRWEPRHLIPMTTWTSSEKSLNLELVSHMAYRSASLHMQRFLVNYPSPKIDLVAVPGLTSNPMENFGLLQFEEQAIFYFSRSNSINDMKMAANRISYGMVHTWFGGFVTMRWWNDTWLSKSFSAYMQYYTTNYVFPDLKETENFVVDDKFPSMIEDGLVSSLPIILPSSCPEGIEELVNSVPVEKGASIIGMLYHMMGDDNFFHGVAHFLQGHRFNTAETHDFIESLQEFYGGGENLTRFVDTWTTHCGFPLLKVQRINNTYYIKQTRFFHNNNISSINIANSSSAWDIMIFYITNISNGTKRIFFPCDSTKITLAVSEKVKWVKFNANSIGYFSVNYDERLWESFSELLQTNPQPLRTLERIDLINDAFMNADAGRIPYHIPMSMLNSVRFQINYVSWKFLSDKFLYLHEMLKNTETLEKFEEFVGNYIRPIYTFIGWDLFPKEYSDSRRLRIAIIKLACTVRMKRCINEVSRRFYSWIAHRNIRPHPDIREIVYYYGKIRMLNVGEKEDWDIVFHLFSAEPDLQERRRLMTSLTAIQNSETLLKYLTMANDTEVMSAREYLITLQAATLNPPDPDDVWNFYRSNWNFLASRYYENDKEFVRLIISITSKFRTKEKYAEAVNFFNDNPHSRFTDMIRLKTLEIIYNKDVWLESNFNQISNWLEDYGLHKNRS